VAAAAAVAAMSLAGPGCGFDDQLTSRGFITAGDSLCEEALGRSALLQQARAQGQPYSDEDVIRTLSNGYSSIAAGLRKLDLRDGDLEMRDAMVRRYEEAAARIDAAAGTASIGNPAAMEEAIAVIDGLRPFAATVRDYGFRVCGGRAPTP
jgi:hypothetical protein